MFGTVFGDNRVKWPLTLLAATFLPVAIAAEAQQSDPHETAMYDENIYVALEDHLKDKIGDFPNVWHELVSPDIHVDVIPIPPDADRDFWVLSTAGMSYREMTLPDEMQDRGFWLRAELTVALPADWFGGDDLDAAIQDEGKYFPIRRLKQLARYPHNAATALLASHTFVFGEPLGPGTQMNSVLIWWPTFLAEGDDVVKLGDEISVNLYSVIPIYESERNYAATNGTDALLNLLGNAGVSSIFDTSREPVI